MTCQVQMTGAVTVGGNGCGCSGGVGSPNQKIQGLGFSCLATTYQAVQSTDCATQITTAGAVGQAWRELPAAESLAAIYLLVVRGNAPFALRIGAAPASLAGTGGTFPTSFGGGETFGCTVDGTAVAVTFTSGAQSAQQVANQINAAAAGVGLTFLPASVSASGQLLLSGKATGKDGALAITTANATIGYPSTASAVGVGADVRSQGLFVNQFDQSSAPSRVQVSGNVQVEVLAAGVAA